MKNLDVNIVADTLYGKILQANNSIEHACEHKLVSALENETNDRAKYALQLIVDNINAAKNQNIALCQDTGMAVVFMQIGQDVRLTGGYINDAVNDAVRRAYRDGSYRTSVCDPLTRKNTNDNTPAVIHTQITKGDKFKLSFIAKGFGSENMSKIYMLTPSQGKQGIIDCVLKTVQDAGSKPCPPIVVGVGIGGDFEKCAMLAKTALLRQTAQPHPDSQVAELETLLLEKINALKIGAQGFGGDTTALSVAIETYPTHIAGLPVAVNIQCYAVRHAEIEF